MLSIIKQPKYLKRLITLPNGEVVLVLFELVEKNGQIIATAISSKLMKDFLNTEETLYLPSLKTIPEFIPIKSTFNKDTSFYTRDYSFVKSQRTRAPSFNS